MKKTSVAQWAGQRQAIDGSSLYCSEELQGIHRSGQTHWGQMERTQAIEGGVGPTNILVPEESLWSRNGGKVYLIGQKVSAKALFLIWSLTDTHSQPCPLQSIAWTF